MQELLQEPFLYALFLSIAGVLGTLLGWHLRDIISVRPLTQALERSEQDRNALAHLYTQLKHQHDMREVDLKKAAIELGQLRQQASAFELDKAVFVSRNQANNLRLEKAEAQAAHYAEKIVFMEEQTMNLRQRNSQVNGELIRLQEELNAWRTLHRDFAAMQMQMRQLERSGEMLEMERNQLRLQLEKARIELENLQSEVLRIQNTEEIAPRRYAPAHGAHAGGPSQVSDVPDQADDLKIINGISPFAERRLQEMGIFTFAQISRWNENDLESVAQALDMPASRIVQEDWIGQAGHLMSGRQE